MSETLIHEISLTGYKATSTAGTLDLGTWGSYGIEKLHLTLDAAWQNLTITAFFNVKGEVVAKTVVGKDGYADVPWEATKENTFAGRIVFEGSLDGQRRVSSDLNFKVTNHSSIADVDSVPTVDRWNQFVTQNKEYRDGAYEAATKAEARAEDAAAASEDAQAAMRAAKASADAAARSETNAGASERAAAGSAAAAATSEGNAAESAKNAASAAKNAAASKSAADTLAAEAARAALAAEESKAAANAAANLAGENATAAQQAAGVATAAANDAGQSASDAAASKAAAETAAQAAQEAQIAAATAKADAVKAQTAAQAAAKTAQDAQSAAEKARDDAQTARQGAEDARDAAAGSAAAAAKSEANAKQSADTLAESVENVAANTAAVAELREKKAEIDDTAVGADAWSSKHIVDMLCPEIKESGNPVQCYPVAGYPLGVKASWEPVQEGEGEPYPAGGGKNLLNFPENTVLKGTGDTELEFPFDLNGDYVFSFKGNVKVVEIDSALWMFEIDGVQKYIVADSGMESLALSGHITKVALTNWGKCTGTILWAQLEKGSTPTAYAPYENIRPIVGRNSVTVERCGENLLKFNERIVKKYICLLDNNDTVFLSKCFRGKQLKLTFTCDTKNIVFKDDVETWRKRIGFECHGFRSNGDEVWALQCWMNEKKYTLTRDGKHTITVVTTMPDIANGEISFYAQSIESGTFTAYDFGIYYGNVLPENYSPYTGQTNTLTLPETIYGGSVDAVRGEGAETWKLLTLDGTETWTFQTTNSPDKYGFIFRVPEIATPTTPQIKVDIVCSQYPTVSANDTYQCKNGISVEANNNHYFRIYNDTYAGGTTDEWKSHLANQYAAGTPVQVCYKLVEPIPFTATGAQPIPALAGVNTVLTDADSVTVTGRADPIKRITDLEDAVASQT